MKSTLLATGNKLCHKQGCSLVFCSLFVCVWLWFGYSALFLDTILKSNFNFKIVNPIGLLSWQLTKMDQRLHLNWCNGIMFQKLITNFSVCVLLAISNESQLVCKYALCNSGISRQTSQLPRTWTFFLFIFHLCMQ